MARFYLPCQSTLPHFQFQCELDSTTYQFEFRWNERTSDWFMSMYDVLGNLLLGEQRVAATNVLAWRKHYDPAMPPGTLICYDTAGNDEDPGFSDLGQRVQIVYYSVVEDGESA